MLFWHLSEIIGNKTSVAMASSDVKPKSISRAKKWSEEIENLYRFQQAGYRDEIEYKQVKQVSVVRFMPPHTWIQNEFVRWWKAFKPAKNHPQERAREYWNSLHPSHFIDRRLKPRRMIFRQTGAKGSFAAQKH